MRSECPLLWPVESHLLHPLGRDDVPASGRSPTFSGTLLKPGISEDLAPQGRKGQFFLVFFFATNKDEIWKKN